VDRCEKRRPRVGCSPRRLFMVALGLIGMLAFVLTSAVPSGASASATKSSKKSLAAYEGCLKKHGVKLPAGNFGSSGSPGTAPSGSTPPSGSFPKGSASGGPLGGSSAKFAKAQKACKSKQPSGVGGGFPGGTGGGSSTALSNVEAYESCLTDNGVKLSGKGPQALSSLNRSKPAVQKAMKTCAPLLSTTTTTTT